MADNNYEGIGVLGHMGLSSVIRTFSSAFSLSTLYFTMKGWIHGGMFLRVDALSLSSTTTATWVQPR